jgi:hypothetical protein
MQYLQQQQDNAKQVKPTGLYNLQCQYDETNIDKRLNSKPKECAPMHGDHVGVTESTIFDQSRTLGLSDLLWTYCTTCCTTNPQQIEQVVYELE